MSLPNKSIQSVKKFYLLEYFYILLKSIEKNSVREDIFNSFKLLKLKYRLGESKYKKLTVDDDESLTKGKLERYRYTFEQVIAESTEYGLVHEDFFGNLKLTEKGIELLEIENTVQFNQKLFHYMENNYRAFRYLIQFLYSANNYRQGLLVLPMYSPRLLGFERTDLRTTAHLIDYSNALVTALEKDIYKHLGRYENLKTKNDELISKLKESKLIPINHSDKFEQKNYNAITKRVRDFWITYFLKDIYKYKQSMNSFDIWTYRGKQIGIIQATEFYPSFSGRIVYPTSIIVGSTRSQDFEKLYDYPDERSLFVHKPIGENNQEKFVDCLVKAYFDLRKTYRNYFIPLPPLRELVCYNMKISERVFEAFLDDAYKLNLERKLKVGISLEVDKLPEETKAMYLKQEPVMVDGHYRNIIAIDITIRGEKAA